MTGARAGVVLAGGGSERFGDRDKALATVDGEPMLARVASRVGEAVGHVVVNCRAEQREAFERALSESGVDVTVAVDPTPDEGPLAGLRTGLDAVGCEYVAVVACDMPGVEPAFLSRLFERAAGHDAAVPVLDDEPQPAQAVYRAPAIRRAAQRQLSNDRRSLRGALGRLDVVEVPVEAVADVPARRSLADLNTREALAAFEADTDG